MGQKNLGLNFFLEKMLVPIIWDNLKIWRQPLKERWPKNVHNNQCSRSSNWKVFHWYPDTDTHTPTLTKSSMRSMPASSSLSTLPTGPSWMPVPISATTFLFANIFCCHTTPCSLYFLQRCMDILKVPNFLRKFFNLVFQVSVYFL